MIAFFIGFSSRFRTSTFGVRDQRPTVRRRRNWFQEPDSNVHWTESKSVVLPVRRSWNTPLEIIVNQKFFSARTSDRHNSSNGRWRKGICSPAAYRTIRRKFRCICIFVLFKKRASLIVRPIPVFYLCNFIICEITFTWNCVFH